jgi:cell division protein FtsW
VVLLLLVFIPGVRSEINYARRWIRFLGMGIQPSEVAKLAIIIFVASICSRNTDFRSFLKCFLITCVVSLLILFEPDFGGAIFVFLVSMVVLFLSGVRLSYIFCGGIIVPCIALLVALIKMPYVIERIYTFMNPSSNPLAEGYQIRQSLIALGSGGLFGEGPGNSIIKLFYLPQAYSDFIFPIIGEEFGFLGSLVIVGLFSAFLYVGSKITVRCKDRFSFLLAGGITFWIVFQAFINLAVTTALLPAKGIPLPFISFGGSSLFCLLTGVGILLNITRQHACN